MNDIFLFSLITYAIISPTICYPKSSICLEDKTDVKWFRQLHVDNQSLPIIIDVTSRTSHRIVSFILKILLVDRLRYKNVTFHEVPWLSPNDTMQRLHNHTNGSLPNAHINLELWQPPGFNVEAWVNRGYVLDCGPLGPIARRGIFTPTETVNLVFDRYNESIDHWRIFEYPRYPWNYSELYKWLTINQSWVTVDGFSPKDIQHTPIVLINRKESHKPLDQIFAKILSPYQRKVIIMTNGTGSLKQTVDEWFHYISNNENISMKSPLFLYDWYPNTVTVHRKYNRVLFPDCYGIKDNPFCDFEVNQLSKMVWGKLKSQATLIYQLVNQFKLLESDLLELLKKVKDENPSDDQLFDIACNWLKLETKWMSWVAGWDVKHKLVIPGLYALYGKWIAENITNVSYLQINSLNEKYFKNTPYELVLDLRNLSCIEDIVLKDYLQYSSTKNASSTVLAYLAAVCSDSLVSTLKVSTFQKRILVTSTADSPKFGNFTQYKYFFRTIPSMRLQNTLLLRIFREWNWKRIAILRKDAMFVDPKLFESNNIEVIEDYQVEESRLVFKDVYQTLDRIRNQKRGRIFLVEYFADATRLIMCAAAKLNMTLQNGYVWFLNSWMNNKWNQHHSDNCTKEEIMEVTNKHFTLAHRGLAYDDYRTKKIWFTPELTKQGNLNPFAIFTLDAIYNIGTAADRLLKENPSALSILHHESVARKFISYISNIDNVDNREIGVTQGNWVLLASINLTRFPVLKWEIPAFGSERELDDYFSKPIIHTSRQSVNDLSVMWGASNNYGPPSDGSDKEENLECLLGFRKIWGLSCSTTAVLFNAGILIPILCIIIGCFLYFFRRLRKTQEEEGIRKPFEFLCEELADLDISGKDVVINRTVGKGNFGIVYGGEARQDNHWVLVAIKAISKKLDFRYKYEFLSEAKLMSNLNHENIVKLIGISLNPNNEMIYLIMEHVTGGDLKKYLIKRRVKAKEDPNNDKINPKRLTKFARDIASGLYYLHQNRYLHRDVACRNCLVNADYGIKVGDFGLARRITKFNRKGGTGYYRFSGLGAMPIRWLPPESLQFGIYSVATDVWSFGVTLYEIVTFGIFPFGGFEHEEVVDKVKRGHFTVANFLPEEFRKNKIYSIINKCCLYNPSERYKSMQEIISIFDQDPECIVPSLTDSPPNLPNSGLFYHSNLMMSEPSHSSHKKLALKLPKEQASGSNKVFSANECQSPNFPSSFTPNDAFYNAFVGLEAPGHKSPPPTVDRHIPVKSQSVEYIHLANPNVDYSFSSQHPTGGSGVADLEVDLGYVTYKTAESAFTPGSATTATTMVSDNFPSRPITLSSNRLPSNYLTAAGATDKIDQAACGNIGGGCGAGSDNNSSGSLGGQDAKTKLVTNHSCSLDLSTDTGCSDIDCMIEKQSHTPLSNECPLDDHCFMSVPLV